MLEVPSIKDYYLVGPQKRAFSLVVPSLWNIIPQKSMDGPQPAAFSKNPKNVALSAGLGTMNGNRADQAVDLIVLLLP